MSPERKPLEYVPESFWEERYSRIDLSRSGHRDLPETYNRWLYRRKQAVLRRGLARIGFAPRGKRVLEIGAGTGYNAAVLAALVGGALVIELPSGTRMVVRDEATYSLICPAPRPAML